MLRYFYYTNYLKPIFAAIFSIIILASVSSLYADNSHLYTWENLITQIQDSYYEYMYFCENTGTKPLFDREQITEKRSEQLLNIWLEDLFDGYSHKLSNSFIQLSAVAHLHNHKDFRLMLQTIPFEVFSKWIKEYLYQLKKRGDLKQASQLQNEIVSLLSESFYWSSSELIIEKKELELVEVFFLNSMICINKCELFVYLGQAMGLETDVVGLELDKEHLAVMTKIIDLNPKTKKYTQRWVVTGLNGMREWKLHGRLLGSCIIQYKTAGLWNIRKMPADQIDDFKNADNITGLGSKYLKAVICNNRGARFEKKARYKLAKAYYIKASKIFSHAPQPYYNLGRRYAHDEAYKKAIENYSRAITTDQQFSDAYNNRAFVYVKLKKYQKAFRDYNKAIALKPNARAYNNRANLYCLLNAYKYAVKDYSNAIKISPETAALYFNRGRAYFRSGLYEKALSDFNTAINKKYVKYPRVLRARADTLYKLKRYKDSLKDYKSLLKYRPGDEHVINRIKDLEFKIPGKSKFCFKHSVYKSPSFYFRTENPSSNTAIVPVPMYLNDMPDNQVLKINR